ncbi:hypothetical protein EVAR_66346_1 [Eumeta japonica]|uniref:Uncharacterized protein n=1 Tax=Eumeta variegata TaxID=151549 RepID=A0A4C2A4I6_EUMVA|nr:hypothetical protein EVAR_66346_1 [Eumeta japonica]
MAINMSDYKCAHAPVRKLQAKCNDIGVRHRTLFAALASSRTAAAFAAPRIGCDSAQTQTGLALPEAASRAPLSSNARRLRNSQKKLAVAGVGGRWRRSGPSFVALASATRPFGRRFKALDRIALSTASLASGIRVFGDVDRAYGGHLFVFHLERAGRRARVAPAREGPPTASIFRSSEDDSQAARACGRRKRLRFYFYDNAAAGDYDQHRGSGRGRVTRRVTAARVPTNTLLNNTVLSERSRRPHTDRSIGVCNRYSGSCVSQIFMMYAIRFICYPSLALRGLRAGEVGRALSAATTFVGKVYCSP